MTPKFNGRSLASALETTRSRIGTLGAKEAGGIISADEQNELNALRANLPDLQKQEQEVEVAQVQGELPSEQGISPEDQEQRLSDIFRKQLGLGSEAIQERFAPIRNRAINEQAAMGSRLTSPIGQESIRGVDVEQGRAVSDLVNRLALNQAEQRIGMGERAKEFSANLGLQRASALQGARTGSRDFGLKKEGIMEDRLGRSLDAIRAGQDDEFASVSGRLQAEAEQEGWGDKAIRVVGALSGAAQPIGAVAGAIRRSNKSSAKILEPKPTASNR